MPAAQKDIWPMRKQHILQHPLYAQQGRDMVTPDFHQMPRLPHRMTLHFTPPTRYVLQHSLYAGQSAMTVWVILKILHSRPPPWKTRTTCYVFGKSRSRNEQKSAKMTHYWTTLSSLCRPILERSCAIMLFCTCTAAEWWNCLNW